MKPDTGRRPLQKANRSAAAAGRDWRSQSRGYATKGFGSLHLLRLRREVRHAESLKLSRSLWVTDEEVARVVIARRGCSRGP